MSQTNQKLDNIENAIKSGDKATQEAIKEQTQAIESGNNILKNIYKNLFTLNSGDLKEIITNAVDESTLGSGDLLIWENIIGIVEDTGEDFIISWDTINTTYLKISGDSINFSKLERENEGLHQAMIWARRIVGLSLLFLFAKNCWNTLLNMLGIGTQIYNKEISDQKAIDRAEETRVNKEKREIATRRRNDKRMYNARIKQQQQAYRKVKKK